MIRKIGILFLVYLFLFPMISLAEYTFELIPRISVSQIYDDNISRERDDDVDTEDYRGDAPSHCQQTVQVVVGK